MNKFIVLSSDRPEELTQSISKHQQRGNDIINTQFSTSGVAGNSKYIITYSVLIEYQVIVSTPQLPKNDLTNRAKCSKCNGKGVYYSNNMMITCLSCRGQGYTIITY